MKNYVLVIGGLITVALTILWYCNIITEPVTAIASALLTTLAYLFTANNDSAKKNKKIIQTHSGIGDNVGGDKIVNQ